MHLCLLHFQSHQDMFLGQPWRWNSLALPCCLWQFSGSRFFAKNCEQTTYMLRCSGKAFDRQQYRPHWNYDRVVHHNYYWGNAPHGLAPSMWHLQIVDFKGMWGNHHHDHHEGGGHDAVRFEAGFRFKFRLRVRVKVGLAYSPLPTHVRRKCNECGYN